MCTWGGLFRAIADEAARVILPARVPRRREPCAPGPAACCVLACCLWERWVWLCAAVGVAVRVSLSVRNY